MNLGGLKRGFVLAEPGRVLSKDAENKDGRMVVIPKVERKTYRNPLRIRVPRSPSSILNSLFSIL
jgi:hypothetical protein